MMPIRSYADMRSRMTRNGLQSGTILRICLQIRRKKALCIRNKAHESPKIDITTLFPARSARKLPVQHIHVGMQIKENSHVYPSVLWLPRFVRMKCSWPLYQISRRKESPEKRTRISPGIHEGSKIDLRRDFLHPRNCYYLPHLVRAIRNRGWNSSLPVPSRLAGPKRTSPSLTARNGLAYQ